MKKIDSSMLIGLICLLTLLALLATSCNFNVLEQEIPGSSTNNEPALGSITLSLEDLMQTRADNAYITLLSSGSNNERVLEINFRPNYQLPLEKVQIMVDYGSKVDGWTLNIGDSISNNGYAGDGGDQSNDAEMQIRNGNLEVYANDYNGSGLIASKSGFINPGNTAYFIIKDKYLYAKNLSTGASFSRFSSALYALAGQADAEGPVNYKIYASINRVIANNARKGQEVEDITMTLYFHVC